MSGYVVIPRRPEVWHVHRCKAAHANAADFLSCALQTTVAGDVAVLCFSDDSHAVTSYDDVTDAVDAQRLGRCSERCVEEHRLITVDLTRQGEVVSGQLTERTGRK